MKKIHKVVVVSGGVASERPVSLRSGKAVGDALAELGYEVIHHDPQEKGFLSLADHKADVVFLALHGKFGEDGTVQGFLETLQIPYTGSGVLTSALCYDKMRTKIFLQQFGVITPRFWIFNRHQKISDFLLDHVIDFPVIVKPNREGSTIGMTICKGKENLEQALEKAGTFDHEILIEEFIQGTEITVGVLQNKALPIIEIVPASGFYDFESKYTPGKTNYILPARLDKDLQQTILHLSENISSWLNCRGAVRMDFIVRDGTPYFLEVNTIPGMTATSLLPKAAQAQEIDFKKLCDLILQSAGLEKSL